MWHDALYDSRRWLGDLGGEGLQQHGDGRNQRRWSLHSLGGGVSRGLRQCTHDPSQQRVGVRRLGLRLHDQNDVGLEGRQGTNEGTAKWPDQLMWHLGTHLTLWGALRVDDARLCRSEIGLR